VCVECSYTEYKEHSLPPVGPTACPLPVPPCASIIRQTLPPNTYLTPSHPHTSTHPCLCRYPSMVGAAIVSVRPLSLASIRVRPGLLSPPPGRSLLGGGGDLGRGLRAQDRALCDRIEGVGVWVDESVD
jgi:hypothetical protein